MTRVTWPASPATRSLSALRSALLSAVAAGLIAGAVAAAFHEVLTEPVIDRAIAAEEARDAGQPGHTHEEPIVSRRGQKIGLVVGLLLYGAVWGVLVGLAVYLTRGWAPPGWSLGRQGLVVALLAGWSVALFPFLKYPANPPGVGEPETIGYRQTLYLGFIVLAVLGLWLAVGLRRFRAASQGPGAWIAPAVFYVVWTLAIYVLMPPNPDPVEISETILRPFRALSLAGLVVFWAGLGLAFGWLARERAPVRRRVAA
jgi:Probable cobalt transporter subunit (CbtA)